MKPITKFVLYYVDDHDIIIDVQSDKTILEKHLKDIGCQPSHRDGTREYWEKNEIICYMIMEHEISSLSDPNSLLLIESI